MPAAHHPSFLKKMSNAPWARGLLANIFRKKLKQKVSADHYPAPFAILNLWEKSYGLADKSYERETD